MRPRDRVLTSFARREPDRAPLFYRDIPEVEARLLRDLGLADRVALLEFLHIDFRWAAPKYIGPPLANPDEPGRRRDVWGVEYVYVPFQEAGEGYWEVAAHPLATREAPEALDDYPWPQLDWFDFEGLADEVAGVGDYALMTSPGFASPGILQCPIQPLVGDARSFELMMCHPGFFDALVDRVMAFNLAFSERMLAAAGGRFDFFRVGDDYGGQEGLLMAPPLWRERIGPALARYAKMARRHGARFYLHTCGGVRDLIPDLIDCGVEVLDPIQVTAAGMDPAALKRDFGDRLCFSGGVDEMNLLREGSPEEVRDGVWRLLDAMGPGGGFFVGPTHNFQPDVPTENVVALYEAAREWRG